MLPGRWSFQVVDDYDDGYYRGGGYYRTGYYDAGYRHRYYDDGYDRRRYYDDGYYRPRRDYRSTCCYRRVSYYQRTGYDDGYYGRHKYGRRNHDGGINDEWLIAGTVVAAILGYQLLTD